MSLLFVHGVGGRPTSWRRVLDALDPEVRSDAAIADVRPRDGQSMADIAHDLLDRYPGSHVVVGHSLGGMLAQEAALLNPPRVHGLVVISAIPGATPVVATHNEVLAAAIESRGLRSVATEFVERLLAPGRSAREPGLALEFVDAMVESGASAVCAGLRAIARWDATDRLPDVTCPAAVVSGDAEPDLDRQRRLAALLDAPIDVLDDTGHLAPLESPGHVARAIERLLRRVE